MAKVLRFKDAATEVAVNVSVMSNGTVINLNGIGVQAQVHLSSNSAKRLGKWLMENG